MKAQTKPLPTFKRWLISEKNKLPDDYNAADMAEYNALAVGPRGLATVAKARAKSPYYLAQ